MILVNYSGKPSRNEVAVPATLETQGEIEVICETTNLAPNRNAKLVFRTWGDAQPPYQIRVRAPSGKVIVERVIRQLPTVDPQSAPPVSFSVQKGEYEISVTQLRGGAEGLATLTIT
ncbi:MAG: hypothetical protein DRI90_00505 [Deltaproteobacteria bacterium]|nr:MAG: hypothetical protein DRI90_00505 [Deltaproteobacteria bacterium]